MKPFILAQNTWKDIKEQEIELAVLPWGATEAHNYHLPYSTDIIQVEKIAAASAEFAWNNGAKIIVLPSIPFGVHTGQPDIKLNINLNPSTQQAILNDIIEVLNKHTIYKFLILNGHGGNDFRQMIRESGLKYPKMFICACNWYDVFDNSDYFENEGDHANEMETSIMQYIAPDFVHPLSEAGDGFARKFKIEAFNEKWAWTERKWSQVTKDTGIGNPFRATPEKGEKCFNDIVRKLGTFLTELSEADINNMYE